MKLWFFSGLRRGIVTTKYPAQPEPSTADLPSPPVFRPELISPQLAERLADVCPSLALRRDGRYLCYDVGACTGCGRCYAVAGAAAVPSGQIELAATDRDQLRKRILIGAPDDPD